MSSGSRSGYSARTSTWPTSSDYHHAIRGDPVHSQIGVYYRSLKRTYARRQSPLCAEVTTDESRQPRKVSCA